MLSKLKRMVPRPLRPGIRRCRECLLQTPTYFMDAFDLLASRRDPLVPPRHIRRFVGGGDYTKISREFLQYFRDLGGLRPGDRVLDVGSGIGRMAAGLTTYLSEEGSYEGFDIVARGVAWCSENITPRFPHFHFVHADIYNKEYNPRGGITASRYMFPYDDASFDFVFLTSVFTHMLPDEVENYLRQISRVLKKNGRCLITFFLVNQEASALVNSGKSSVDFRFRFGQWVTTSEEIPEAVIGFDEDFVRASYCKTDLHIEDPIRYGSWCGRKNYLSYQDIVLAVKASLPSQ